jgi:hypothetical protein
MNRQGPLFAPVVREGQTTTEAEKKLRSVIIRESLRADSTDESLAQAVADTWVEEAIEATWYELDDADVPGFMLALAATTKGIGPRERRAKAGAKDKALLEKVATKKAPSVHQFLMTQASRIIPKAVEGLGSLGPDEEYSINSVDWSREDKLLQKEMAGLHLLAGQTSWKAMPANHGLDVDASFDLANPDVKRLIGKLAKKVVRVNRETKAQIEDHVKKGLDAGLKSDAIAAELRTFVQETYKNRAKAIARTESMHAYGEANVLGFKDSGIVKRAQLFDNPEHTEDYGAEDGLTCAERDGFECPLDEAMGHVYADHPNGSAVITPIVEGEED